MREKLITYVKNLFRNAPETPRNLDLEAEVLQNSLDRFDDLVSRGIPEEKAYAQAIGSIGDVRHLLEEPVYQPVPASGRRMFGKTLGRICAVLVVLAVLLALATAADQWLEYRREMKPTIFFHGSEAPYSDGDSYQMGAASVPGSVRELEIHWIAGHVVLQPWEGSTVELEESGAETDEARLHWRLDNGILTVQYSKAGRYKELPVKDLTVKLPEAMAEKMRVNMETTSADCRVVALTLAELEFDSTSGSLEAEGTFRELSADTTSGQVTFRGKAQNLDVDTTSGDAELTCLETPGELSFDSTSGDLKVFLNGGSAFRAEFETVSGDFRSSLAEARGDGVYVYLPEGGGEMAELELSTVSGDVTIKKTQ